MCRHFLIVPDDELTRIIAAIRKNLASGGAARAGGDDWPQGGPPAPEAGAEAFPKAGVAVLVARQGRLEAEAMRWGYPVAWQKAPVFNARAETATADGWNMWADSLARRRCVVPSYGFYEPHQSETVPSPKTGRPLKREYLFRLPGSPLVLMAGLYQDGHFTIVTTAPNRWVAPVHDRMPVVLRPGELGRWLDDGDTGLFDRAGVELAAQAV